MINFKLLQSEKGPYVFNHILNLQGFLLASTVGSDLTIFKKDKASISHHKTMSRLTKAPIVSMASTVDKSYAIVVDEESFVLLYPGEDFRTVHRASLPRDFYPRSVICTPDSEYFLIQGRQSLIIYSFNKLKEPITLDEVVGEDTFITSTAFKDNLLLVADDSGTILCLDMLRLDQGVDEATTSIIALDGAIQDIKIQGEWVYAFSSTWDICVMKLTNEELELKNTVLNIRPSIEGGVELSQPISYNIQRGIIQILSCGSNGIVTAALYKLNGADISPSDIAYMSGPKAYVCDAVASSIAMDSRCVVYAAEYEQGAINVFVRQ